MHPQWHSAAVIVRMQKQLLQRLIKRYCGSCGTDRAVPTETKYIYPKYVLLVWRRWCDEKVSPVQVDVLLWQALPGE